MKLILFFVFFLSLFHQNVQSLKLIVKLKNVPYNANLTILCEQMIRLYFTVKPTNYGQYCDDHMTFQLQNFECIQVNFDNTSTTVQLDSAPTTLNAVLRNSTTFFSLASGGEALLVADQINNTHLVMIILGVVISVSPMLFIMMLFATSSCPCCPCCYGRQHSKLQQEEVADPEQSESLTKVVGGKH